mmetsp:Transcript_83672/g.270516  ORF Transcript_83672/g.270516 Transcript_83672/m.270516 type:complete len:172 (+) Transcript_83672:309-824(+)
MPSCTSVRTCHTLMDSMKWVGDAIERVLLDVSADRLCELLRGRALSVSSVFSGIGTSDIAMRAICDGFNQLLNTKGAEPVLLTEHFCVEQHIPGQEELMELLYPTSPIETSVICHAGPCIFGDITSVLHEGMVDALKAGVRTEAPETFKDQILRAPLKETMWCVAHGKFCP